MQGSKLKRAASIAEGAGHKSRTTGQPPGHLARYKPHARVAHVRHCRQPLRARRPSRGARRDRRRRPRLAQGTVARRAAGALRSAVALLGADSGAGTGAATGDSRPAQVGGSCDGPRQDGRGRCRGRRASTAAVAAADLPERGVGAHSQAALRLQRRAQPRRLGINENLAREILELHTLGVGGGYTQADVTTFAEVITGWSIGGDVGRFPRGEPGEFLFRAELHEPGAKVVLGKRYPDTGYDQGVAVLRDLAANTATAHFIATKLARHFIADDPPPRAVERIASAFLSSDGHLPTVYRALIEAPEAWAQPLSKYKTPNDYIVST